MSKYWLCGSGYFSSNDSYCLLVHGMIGMKSVELAGTASLSNTSAI
jgi:hypothetical protein